MGAAVLGTWFIVTPLGAQYNPPGTSISGGLFTDEEELRTSMEEARWRLGVLKLQPWIGVRDASFVSSSSEDGSDFTASAGAGLRAYFRTGRKLIWTAHALPEYVWWQDDEDRRRLNGRYGTGLFAYFNRLSLEVSLRREEVQSFFSSEVQQLATTRNDTARVAFELTLADRFELHGGYTFSKASSQERETTVFGLLDLESEEARLRLIYRSPRKFWAGVGLEDVANEFAEGARNLSHDGEAVLLDAGFEGQRFGAALGLEIRSLEPRPGSDFADFRTTTGYLETQWTAHRSVEIFVYGRRQLGYSVEVANSSFMNERVGARVGFDLRNTLLDLVAETGRDAYRAIDLTAPQRFDDVAAFGMSLSFDMRGIFQVKLGVNHTEYDSNLADRDRDITAWTATVQLRSLGEKLRFGKSEAIW